MFPRGLQSQGGISMPQQRISFDLDDQLVGDNPTTAKPLPANQKLKHMETQVTQVKLPNRSGELARAASELGEADVKINYARRQNE